MNEIIVIPMPEPIAIFMRKYGIDYTSDQYIFFVDKTIQFSKCSVYNITGDCYDLLEDVYKMFRASRTEDVAEIKFIVELLSSTITSHLLLANKLNSAIYHNESTRNRLALITYTI